MEIQAPNGQIAYHRTIAHILRNGYFRQPRGKSTLDAGFTTILLTSPRDALPMNCGRSLNTKIAAAEAIQLIGGFSDPDLLLKISPKFEEYLNGDGFHGAYGSRIRMQVPSAINKLGRDFNSRQAVITLWDAHLDNLPDMNDYPCTVALQFEITSLPDGSMQRLNMNVIMRSNDAWLGLPYDMFQFTQLQLSVCSAMAIPPGWYRHTALSMHLYEDDIPDKAANVYSPTATWQSPNGIGVWGMNMHDIMKRARQIARGNIIDEKLTAGEAWYREQFASYMG